MQRSLGRYGIGLALMLCWPTACQAQAPRAAKVTAVPDNTVFSIAGEEDLRLDPAVPSPRAVLGFEVGSRPVRHLELAHYLHRLAESSQRVVLKEYGKTHEGRNLYYLVISEPTNISKLDEIRRDLGTLADPRTADDAEAHRLIDTSPAVAWLSYTIHGDELSGTDAAILVAYRLAAGQNAAITSLLKSVVVCIDPLQNPDGRERFMSAMQHLSGRVANPDTQSAEHSGQWPGGRTNHYLFDMNRDWNVTVHPESRGRVQAISKWHPQLFVDAHEMGSTDTYLFSPPREPLNTHIPPTVLKWMDRYSADQAAAFDRRGWSYYRGEWNEGWAIGFSDIWAKHHGAVGILYEQAGSEGSVIRLPTQQNRHYPEDVAHQYVSSMANLKTLADHRKEILADFYAGKKRAVADAGGAGGRDTFLFIPGPNRTRDAEFLATLQRQNIEAFELQNETVLQDVVDHWGNVQEQRAFPRGTVALSMKQPLSPLARAMLEFDPRPADDFLQTERRELELKNRSRFYDVSGWCVSMCFDVDAYWARGGGLPPLAGRAAADPAGILTKSTPTPARPKPRESPYGYLIDGADDAGIRLAGRLLQEGWKVRVGLKPFTAAGRPYAPGTFLVRMHENDKPVDDLVARLDELPAVPWTSVKTASTTEGPDLGGRRFPLLQEPRIALIFDSPFSSYSAGAIWHLLDARMGLRISRLSASRLGRYDLRKYNCIVLPSAWGGGVSRWLDDGTRNRLEQWVKEGGTLVAVGRSAAALCKAEGGLGSVRLRRDVLESLDVYAEAVARERAAPAPQIDLTELWKSPTSRPEATSQPAQEPKKKPDVAALKRWDAWALRFMPRGTLLRADLHPEHWLAHGFQTRDPGAESTDTAARVPVMYGASHVLMSMSPVETIARLAPSDALRLSGLLWPEARQRLGDGACMTRERLGRGQIVLFATDPVFRGYMHGTTRLFLNAVVLGPGVGASTPLPW